MPRHVLTAVGAGGEPIGQEARDTAPPLALVASYGDLHACDYVTVTQDAAVSLYARDPDGIWCVVCAGTDAVTVDEMRLWFDLTHHFPGPGRTAGSHPLGRAPAAGAGGSIDAAGAVALVREHIDARGLDYPSQGLEADRFAAGWSVYAPVDIDDSDPMAFLDLPLDRSVFLISDVGRIKEVTTAIPPGQARTLFTAEEAFVRRAPVEESFMNSFKEEFERLDALSGRPSAIADFTVVSTPPEEQIAGRVAALAQETAQQLALLGPAQWQRMTAVFSCAVSAERAGVSFWDHEQPLDVRVPEQVALLVRRQRHLAAAMPAGPWLRMLLTITKGADGRAQVATEYDYGDERLADAHLLAPAHYRNDLAAYPRAEVPAWLTRYAAGHGRRPERAGAEPSRTPAARVEPSRPEPAERPFVESRVGRSSLVADRHRVSYGHDTLDWDEVDWVRYPVSRMKHQGFLFPSLYTNTYAFGVGTYADSPGKLGRISWDNGGKRSTPPEEWVALVDFVQRVVEPRLLAQHLDLIRRGGAFTIGEVRVHRDGLTLRGVMDADWRALTRIEVAHGLVSVHEQGRSQPLRVSLDSPNAVLLPRLVEAMTG
ncbi:MULTISPECIES: hypothetical protein [unclassified Streptomyces]|uniref:hypothetical protein n=1 Tax=unclassified Streptomyces TaxID=2593676 RepID=UPI0003A173CD|nr:MULTISPECIES: hypothetical protein [unclassified Streptomyces]MYY05161.1 hypothetical protein [Streptomyces sp. SID4913]